MCKNVFGSVKKRLKVLKESCVLIYNRAIILKLALRLGG